MRGAARGRGARPGPGRGGPAHATSQITQGVFVFARHAEPVANAAGVLSTNPARPVPLTARGRAQARVLGAQLAGLRVDLAAGTRLVRIGVATSWWESIARALSHGCDRPVNVDNRPVRKALGLGEIHSQWLGQVLE